ncbi:VWA domain-containing protein [Wenzhouxiangella sp. C33]|uniref:VWA domain-containing protein n=1 Tax=Wenzhouxiangella limi TaxID=2707351 RepID=A0A845US32_9GAMM|nr:VWA domain-containing protein [Wenzhouxiangella limi]
MAVSIVIDRSTSLSNADLMNMQSAANDFIGLLANDDEVAIWQFNGNIDRLQDFTTDKALASGAVNSITLQGSTAIYDAVADAAAYSQTATGRKAIVLFTDGRDNRSSRSKAQAIDAAIAAGTPVFTIGFGNADPNVLDSIATQSGGLAFQDATSANLGALLANIGDLLNNQYVLSWQPPVGDGRSHTIGITVADQGLSDDESRDYTQANSPCGGTCSAERSLPSGYGLNVNNPISIELDSTGQTETFSIVEQLPAGWTATDITQGGVFDGQSGTIQWDNLAPDQVTSLAYNAQTAVDNGTVQFIGTTSFGIRQEAVCGPETLEVGNFFPADINGDFRVDINELTAYGAAWKNDRGWPVEPSPIPLDYAVLAGTLWLNGEAYFFDPNLDPPFASGTATTSQSRVASNLARSVLTARQVAATAERQLPAGFLPGQPITVSIDVSLQNGVVYALTETPPEGWTVENITEGGVYVEQTGQINWGLFFDGQDRTLEYDLIPPADVQAESFFGRLNVDGESFEVTGDTQLNRQSGRIFKDSFEAKASGGVN